MSVGELIGQQWILTAPHARSGAYRKKDGLPTDDVNDAECFSSKAAALAAAKKSGEGWVPEPLVNYLRVDQPPKPIDKPVKPKQKK